jgi:hypothetical protein
MFADTFPGQIADDFLNNAPTNVPFTIYGPAFGGGNNLLIPGATATVASTSTDLQSARRLALRPHTEAPSSVSYVSAQSIAAASAKAFSAGFPLGATNATLSTLNGFSSPNLYTAVSQIYNPSYVEWSLAVEQQFTSKDTVSVMYVGNHSYHEPELNNGVNAFNGGGASGFTDVPGAAPNPNFAAVTEISSSSSGNFNGVVLSEQHRARNLTVTFNYQYSHALDDISNGGFDGFSGNSVNPDDPYDLRKSYGNADYDTRHYVSGSYIYSMPHFWGPKVLVDNWIVAGTIFHSTGLPFSVVDTGTASGLANYGGPLYAQQIAPIKGHTHCGGESVANGTPCAFANDYGSATDFGQSRRNQMFGPNYTDSDFSISKGFVMPGTESAKLKLGIQFFNVFNHPNFGQPVANVASGADGLIFGTVNPPTSILGSFLGGNASPRLAQLNAKFDF